MRDEINFTQQQLVFALKANQRTAFEYFYDYSSPGLYGIICNIIPDQIIAQQVLHETFIEFWQNIRSYDSKSGSVFNWALRIARQKAMDRAKISQLGD
ncbi:RNA polymerase sigma factor [Dyadobacter sp. CY347]|uniref:RNA polymerase sigma factor n=1 Tax=Dyadobacter sp. CY347 TaxID=2909336 RepID=UPI0038D4004F